MLNYAGVSVLATQRYVSITSSLYYYSLFLHTTFITCYCYIVAIFACTVNVYMFVSSVNALLLYITLLLFSGIAPLDRS